MTLGWRHKGFWVLPWADIPIPEVGKTIEHSWGDKYTVLFTKDDLVVLEKKKLEKVV
jgi:hypothetical protein